MRGADVGDGKATAVEGQADTNGLDQLHTDAAHSGDDMAAASANDRLEQVRGLDKEQLSSMFGVGISMNVNLSPVCIVCSTIDPSLTPFPKLRLTVGLLETVTSKGTSCPDASQCKNMTALCKAPLTLWKSAFR